MALTADEIQTRSTSTIEPLPGIIAFPGDTSTATATTLLTGRVNSDGTIAGGTGFTVVANGSGSYDITFTSPFAATPVVLCMSTNASTQHAISSITTSGFHYQAQGAANADFNFTVTATQ